MKFDSKYLILLLLSLITMMGTILCNVFTKENKTEIFTLSFSLSSLHLIYLLILSILERKITMMIQYSKTYVKYYGVNN